MEASLWLTLLGVAAGTFAFIVTALSLISINRACNRMQVLPKTAMTLAISQVLHEESEYQTAARRIDEIERRYVVVAKGQEYLALRRLAARRGFAAAIDKGASFEDISARFHRICAVGFRSMLSELATLVEFAYACLEHGHREEGLRVLAQARERLPDAAIDSQSRLPALIDWCGKLLESSDGH